MCLWWSLRIVPWVRALDPLKHRPEWILKFPPEGPGTRPFWGIAWKSWNCQVFGPQNTCSGCGVQQLKTLVGVIVSSNNLLLMRNVEQFIL